MACGCHRPKAFYDLAVKLLVGAVVSSEGWKFGNGYIGSHFTMLFPCVYVVHFSQ